MCGIITYTGKREAAQLLIEGLKRLEYRGYDSAGMAVLNHDLKVIREVGPIVNLERKLGKSMPGGRVGIAHTRWATHGKPSEANAHPHRDCRGTIAVVHNGIVENYAVLKADLVRKGHRFESETDTEVIAHLIEAAYDGDLEKAVRAALREVYGTFGLAVIHAQHPDLIVAARRSSPLLVGVGEGENFVASDAAAIVSYTKHVKYLEEDEIAIVSPDQCTIKSLSGNGSIARQEEKIEWDAEATEKQGHAHFMLKEIFEQPDVIRNAMRGRILKSEGQVKLGGLRPVIDVLKQKRRMVIVSCGTSYYAGLVGRYVLEELTDLAVEVELASEFRYRRLNLVDDTVLLAISQSGETADTLAAVREAKLKGALCLGLVNVVGSTVARETGVGVYNHAGPEIGVASTKVFTSQLAILNLLAVLLGRHRRLSLCDGQRILEGLERIPEQIGAILERRAEIEAVAERYAKHAHFVFIGRKFNYPIALEAALKMKEISYLHAEGYAAGELKHGPIALIDASYACVGICPRGDMQAKMISNLQEMKARGGRILAIVTEGDRAADGIADDVIQVPDALEMLSPLLTIVPLQLLAYHVARKLGREIDRPRNLAKSVTVE